VNQADREVDSGSEILPSYPPKNTCFTPLVRNAAAEITTFYYYTILRVNLIGLDGEGIKEIAETARRRS